MQLIMQGFLHGQEMFLKHLCLRKISKYFFILSYYNISFFLSYYLFILILFYRDLKQEVFQKLLKDSVGLTPTEKTMIESSHSIRGKFEDFLQSCWRNWKSNEKRYDVFPHHYSLFSF